MTPRTMRIAAAIHYHASAAGWAVTMSELADATGESIHVIRGVLQGKGWTRRIRMASGHSGQYGGSYGGSAPPAFYGAHIAREIVAGKIGVDE